MEEEKGKRAVYCIDDLWKFVAAISHDNLFRSIVRFVQLRGCKNVILKLYCSRKPIARMLVWLLV